MSSSVTLRYYNVTKSHDSDPVEYVLRKIFKKAMEDREVELDGEIALRLEHLEEDDGVLFGDLTRVQTRNLPGQVLKDKTDKLPFDRLGHYIAFAYDPIANVLALQFDRRARAGVVLRYLSEFTAKSVYVHTPIISGTDSLKALEKEDVKAFRVRIGGIHRFESQGTARSEFMDTLASMGEFFDGRQVEVKISTQATKSPMNTGKVVSTIKSLLRLKDESDNVKAIYADTFDGHDPYNFIKELLRDSAELPLPDNDPTKNRELRVDFAKESYGNHKSTLRSQNASN